MSIFSWISDIFKPAATLIDEIHVSEEEKGRLRNELAKIQSEANAKILEFESKIVDAESKVREAEAKSDHWLTSNWRPLSSISIVSIVILASFGIIDKPDASFYELAKVILGTYVGGRSLEKLGKVVKLGGK